MLYCIIVLIVCTLLYIYMAMNIVTMFYANKVLVLYLYLTDSFYTKEILMCPNLLLRN